MECIWAAPFGESASILPFSASETALPGPRATARFELSLLHVRICGTILPVQSNRAECTILGVNVRQEHKMECRTVKTAAT